MLILSYESETSFTCKLNSFSYEWLCTRPRFEREALGNSEMVYYLSALRLKPLSFNNILIWSLTVPLSFTTTPRDQTIEEGDNGTFHCKATGNPTPKIVWHKDGKTVATGDTLSFKVNRNQSGRYWCSAENGLGLKLNASALLDVQCKF